MKAIEVNGTVNPQGQLSLDKPLAITKQSRVRVIILVPEEVDAQDDELVTATESFRKGWYDAMSGNTIPISQLWDGIDAD
jgi:hypothetical protein